MRAFYTTNITTPHHATPHHIHNPMHIFHLDVSCFSGRRVLIGLWIMERARWECSANTAEKKSKRRRDCRRAFNLLRSANFTVNYSSLNIICNRNGFDVVAAHETKSKSKCKLNLSGGKFMCSTFYHSASTAVQIHKWPQSRFSAPNSHFCFFYFFFFQYANQINTLIKIQIQFCGLSVSRSQFKIAHGQICAHQNVILGMKSINFPI